MKKRNVKSLKLRKNSISNLRNEQIKGGQKETQGACTSYIDACPTAWCQTQQRNCTW